MTPQASPAMEQEKPYLHVRRLTFWQWLEAILLRRAWVDGERHRFKGWLPFLAYRDHDPGADSIYYAPFAKATGLNPGKADWPGVQAAFTGRPRARDRFLHEAWWHDGDHRGPVAHTHAPSGLGARTPLTRGEASRGEIDLAWRLLGEWYAGIHVH